MAAQIFSFDDFNSFLNREIGRISRYNYNLSEKFSVVLVLLDHDDVGAAGIILADNLRQSDAIFQKRDAYFLLLSNTDRMGALHIEEMLKEVLEKNIRIIISEYPEDGESGWDVMNMIDEIASDSYGIDLASYFE